MPIVRYVKHFLGTNTEMLVSKLIVDKCVWKFSFNIKQGKPFAYVSVTEQFGYYSGEYKNLKCQLLLVRY